MIIFNLLLSFFVDAIFTDENNEALGQMINQVVAVITQPITFSWGPAFMVYFQGISLLIAIAAVIVNGIKNGILINGGTEDESVGHYIFRSSWPIAIIAATPLIMTTATTVANYAIDDLSMSATGIDYGETLKAVLLMQGNPVTQIIGIIGAIAVIYYTVTVIFQCVKRQIQLTVLSIIGPLVAAATVSENNSGDFVMLLKEMAGTAVITALQISLLLSAISLPATTGFVSAIPTAIQPFLIVGVFGAIKHLPRWIERYALAPQVSGGGMGRVTMAAAYAGRSMISKAVK